jgi:V8-like Glu-specific endopeptidase
VAALLSVLALAATACAQTQEREEREAKTRAAVVGGKSDTGDPAVVAITRRPTVCDAPTPTPFCSGALIAPRVVLTAAHCLVDVGPTAALQVFFGNDVTDPSGTADVVVASAVHPGYDPATHEMDVALLRLADDPKITPLTLGGDPGPVGTIARVVGFGVDADASSVPGTKRDGDTKIESVTSTAFTTVPSPAMTCAGDSGGPVLIGGVDGGGEVLVGVTSKGDTACKATAFNVRVDAVRAFIDPFVAATAGAPAGMPSGTIALPEICARACATSSDCPAALECDETDAARCVLSGLPPSSFAEECSATAPCTMGATCTRVWPSGPGACRCALPCEGAPIPPDAAADGADAGQAGTSDDGGCSLSGARRQSATSCAASALALLTMISCAWRRARRVSPSTCSPRSRCAGSRSSPRRSR